MIHRALFGSFERFIGILLEHLDGALPVWLAPVQAIVLPITDRQNEAGAGVLGALGGAGLRAELDARSESVGAQDPRRASCARSRYMLVVGEREAAAGTVAVRERARRRRRRRRARRVRRAAARRDRPRARRAADNGSPRARAPRYTRPSWPSHHPPCRARPPLDARS